MKQALMMVAALGLGSMSHANASVTNSKVQAEYEANSQIQTDANGEVSLSPELMKRKVAELNGKYIKFVPTNQSSKPVVANLQNNPSNNNNPQSAQSSDTLLGLISDLESKASAITSENDALAAYESNMKARRLADEKKIEKAKLEKIAKAKEEADAKKAALKAAAKKKKSAKKAALKAAAKKKAYSKKASNKKFTAKKKKVTRNSRKLNSRSRPVIAAKRAARTAHSRSKGLCARYVRKALQSAGYRFTPNPSAYQYATRGTLRKAGFVKVKNSSKSQIGDVVVISRSRAHKHGHMAIYDGRRWVSDFRQKGKSPYRNKSYAYTTWRDARYVNASSNGLYMAGR